MAKRWRATYMSTYVCMACDGGCGASIRRGGWWACAQCDYDVCPRCYAVRVKEGDAEWKEEEERAEAEAAMAGQSVGLQEEDPLRCAGGLDPGGGTRTA